MASFLELPGTDADTTVFVPIDKVLQVTVLNEQQNALKLQVFLLDRSMVEVNGQAAQNLLAVLRTQTQA